MSTLRAKLSDLFVMQMQTKRRIDEVAARADRIEAQQVRLAMQAEITQSAVRELVRTVINFGTKLDLARSPTTDTETEHE